MTLGLDVPTIQKMYADGQSLNAISIQLGCSSQTVHRKLKGSGVTLRPSVGGGPYHSQWRGGRVRHKAGYWKVWISEDDPMRAMCCHGSGSVAEHRLVMARKLGRPLRSSETVHHINGDKGDNQLKNLQLRHGKHGYGIAMHCLDCGSTNLGVENLK